MARENRKDSHRTTKELEKELGPRKGNHREVRDRNNIARARTTRSVFFVDEKDTRQPSAGQDECAITVTKHDTP